MSFLRVMTLNIWSQQGPWPRRKELLAAELQTQAADVVALQEVLSFTPVPAPGLDAPPPPFPTQADELRADLYPYSAFAPACPVDARRTLGNALLSRFPIVQQSTVPLPNAVGPGHEPRVLLCALLELSQGLLPVFVTHLDWQLQLSHARCQQVRFIADHIDAYVAAARQLGRGLLPPILAGDLNAEPDSDEVRFLTGRHALPGPLGEPLRGAYFNDCYARAADPTDFAARAVAAGATAEVSDGGATFARSNAFAAAAHEPDRRIDYLLVGLPDKSGRGRPIRCWRCCRHGVIDASVNSAGQLIFPSDHYGVVADLAL